MKPSDYMHIAEGAAELLDELGLNDVEAALSYRGGRFAALSSTSDTLEIFPPTGTERIPSVYMKRYRYPKRSQRIKAVLRGSWFRKSRARFEFDRLSSMRTRGIRTIEPLAVGERRIAGLVTAGILITRGVAGQSLLSFAKTADDLSPADRRSIVTKLAQKVRRMHEAGVVHGSMVWRDIIIHKNVSGEYDFTFLDPGYVKRFYLPGCRRLGYMRDIIDLAATATLLCHKSDRLRFVKSYIGITKLNFRHRLWLKIIAWRAGRLTAKEKHRMEVDDIFLPPNQAK
ncbi:MAG: hypothetical protein JSV03_00695 [Planctomycetota bacterium]|nr:MAG: hypothetical protein JSV03_00695 [Planctomycetota bacterium]